MSNFKQIESKWIGRSLTNYKTIHKGTAEKKGVLPQLQKATTLTAAKKIVFGLKKGNTPLRK